MIRHLLAPNPGPMTGPGTNTYLLDDGQGNVLVVDPGPEDHPEHIQRIEREAAEIGRIRAILVTHGHLDHLPGAYPIREHTGAPIVGHALLPNVDESLANEQTFRVGGLELVALDTPGHTDDSLCYWDVRSRTLFTGDVIAGSGTIVVDDRRGGLAKYMRSLRLLQDLGESTVYPGHGPLVPDGHAKAVEYYDHRAQREQQVLAELARGPRSIDQLVQAIYPDVIPALVRPAGRNVRSHLQKLEDEQRVRPLADGERWELSPTA